MLGKNKRGKIFVAKFFEKLKAEETVKNQFIAIKLWDY